jgi:hypothetical protein
MPGVVGGVTPICEIVVWSSVGGIGMTRRARLARLARLAWPAWLGLVAPLALAGQGNA